MRKDVTLNNDELYPAPNYLMHRCLKENNNDVTQRSDSQWSGASSGIQQRMLEALQIQDNKIFSSSDSFGKFCGSIVQYS